MNGTPEIIAFGEPLVALYPDRSPGGSPNGYTMTWGGDASNFCLAAAKLDGRAALLTCLGTDHFGDRFIELWQENGVLTDLVQRDPGRSTGLYFAVFTGDSHSMVYYRKGSAATAVRRNDIPWDTIGHAKLLHLSGISQAISVDMLDLSFELMRFARENDVLVSYDVNYRPPLWPPDHAAAVARQAAHYADILTITDEEMALLGFGDEPGDLIDAIPGLPEFSVVKCGANGAAVVSSDGVTRIPGFAVDVQDTVGAGDAFDAALTVELLRGKGIVQAVTFAAAAGAAVCTGVGPLDAQPDRDNVEKLIEKALTKEQERDQ